MFLIGFPSLAVTLLVEGLLQRQYLGSDNQPGLRACVAIIAVYFAVDQLIDGPGFIWMSEIFPTVIRAKGISIGFASYFVACITYTTPGALAFKNM